MANILLFFSFSILASITSGALLLIALISQLSIQLVGNVKEVPGKIRGLSVHVDLIHRYHTYQRRLSDYLGKCL